MLLVTGHRHFVVVLERRVGGARLRGDLEAAIADTGDHALLALQRHRVAQRRAHAVPWHT